ncbi:hypothetical protein FRB94_010642 [Tulasnella sp. JGI-2019a]|nr:hypothetical protein FRB94_010642 [Tulasnella sp. JGI-2019a]KAG9011334.1 hypothetical protein FRB93_003136 [Tulasnella sp. JGI-2019a]KAG9037381.1 hypothetical protein FRB95_005670 [Tulasnella sp. JGI-2019a]
MSYTINIDLKNSGKLAVDDQAVADGSAAWSGEGLFDMSLKLTMASSGNSGALLCRRSKDGDSCCIVLGVHNYAPWCNIVTDVSPSDTASGILLSFYAGGSRRSGWVQVVEERKTTSKGTSVQVKFTKVDGNSLNAEINIA